MTKEIRMHINYTNLLQRFAQDALMHMEAFTRSNGTIDYEGVYGFAHALRVVLACIDTTDSNNLKALLAFREGYDTAATAMFARLNELRETEMVSE